MRLVTSLILNVLLLQSPSFLTSFRLCLHMSSSRPGIYLERMVERKKIEVNALLKQHQDQNDPLFMRMAYIASENKFLVTSAVKTTSAESSGSDAHLMTVMIDMKRKSPTVPANRNIVEYTKADKFCELLTLSGVDSFLINTDQYEYGTAESDLKDCAKVSKLARPLKPPAIIHKDIIIHPIQVLLKF